jgi:hypothetical protein
MHFKLNMGISHDKFTLYDSRNYCKKLLQDIHCCDLLGENELQTFQHSPLTNNLLSVRDFFTVLLTDCDIS